MESDACSCAVVPAADTQFPVLHLHGQQGHDGCACTCTQVTLAAGRTEAAAQRTVERESRARQRAAAKERGRRRAALLEANKGLGCSPCNPLFMGTCMRVNATAGTWAGSAVYCKRTASPMSIVASSLFSILGDQGEWPCLASSSERIGTDAYC